MKGELPPFKSLVCVDNTIIFKAVYNPSSIVTEVFSILVLEKSCGLYTTEKTFSDVKKLCKERS